MQSIAEIWKDIQGYEGLYQVSNLGRVKSLVRGHYWQKERILTTVKQTKGYMIVSLSKNGKEKNFRVHRLVAVAFIPNPENKPEVDHINADKTNNNVNNLRWAFHKENIRNPLNMVHLIGENNPMFGKKHSEETKEKIRKNHADFSGALNPKARKVKNIDTNEIFLTVKSAGQKYGISDNSIRQAIKNNGRSAGYHWEYV